MQNSVKYVVYFIVIIFAFLFQDIFSECIYFDEILCENVRSFPPKVENVRVEIQPDYNVSTGDVPKIWFAVNWDVPRVGKNVV